MPENKPDPVPETQPGPVINGFVEVIENRGIVVSEIHPSCGYNTQLTTNSQLSSGPVSIQEPLCLSHVQSDMGTAAISEISESSQGEIEKVRDDVDETCPQPNPPIWVPQSVEEGRSDGEMKSSKGRMTLEELKESEIV